MTLIRLIWVCTVSVELDDPDQTDLRLHCFCRIGRFICPNIQGFYDRKFFHLPEQSSISSRYSERPWSDCSLPIDAAEMNWTMFWWPDNFF